MLTFNQLIEAAGLPLDRTRFVRHKDDRPTAKTQPYWLWQRKDGSFERYQSIQKNDKFKPGRILASFVVSPTQETIFVGMYRVLDQGMVEDPNEVCPVSEQSVLGNHRYTIERLDDLSEYEGRVLIDWGTAYLAWVQRADAQVKPILELRPSRHETPFPGFSQFIWPISQLDDIPKGWHTHLSQAFGVYLLVSHKARKHYVGSALGEEGFLQRWRQYQRNGHGGNVDLKEVADGGYQVCILEAASSMATNKEVQALESLWKEKLLSRVYGLNRN